MAIKVRETPILSGKDARRFEEEIKHNENKKVPKEDYERAMKVYRESQLIS
jgi:hypothetical protein